MDKKICSKCGVEKEFSEFIKGNDKFKLNYNCKKCLKEYRENNKEEIKERNKKYYKENKEKFKEKNKEYREENKEKIKEYYKEYSENNKEKIKERNKEYRENNKEKNKERNKKYYKENKERAKEYRENNKERAKEYREKNKERIKEYHKNRKKTDPLFKMKCYLRTRTGIAFKRKKWVKGKGTEKLLGCNFEIAHKHLERQFTKGMTWENYGEWHIDHIIPLASAKTEEELRKLCHYTNLQPLWASDNMSKGDKMPNVQTKLRM